MLYFLLLFTSHIAAQHPDFDMTFVSGIRFHKKGEAGLFHKSKMNAGIKGWEDVIAREFQEHHKKDFSQASFDDIKKFVPSPPPPPPHTHATTAATPITFTLTFA